MKNFVYPIPQKISIDCAIEKGCLNKRIFLLRKEIISIEIKNSFNDIGNVRTAIERIR